MSRRDVRSKRVEAVFSKALDQEQDERDAFLEVECGGDSSLYREVRALLSACETEPRFFEDLFARVGREAGEAAREEAEHTPKHPEQVGPYKIERFLGRGGMGSVYLTKQDKLGRPVALKILRDPPGSTGVSAHPEWRVLARMDHPNIAKVVEANELGDGLWYVVMEYVDGLPITTYCIECRLALRDRLRLFMGVCEGVQHAHQKGVVHRDLKPTNILVKTEEEKPIPRVIDFGIARVLGEEAKCLAVAGTPAYMSPEQSAGQDDSDTRTDVYALGVILYELLVEKHPFDVEALRQTSWDDAFRVIRDTERLPPSRLCRKSSRSTVTNERDPHIRSIQEAVSKDLDWITMKAMEKDPQNRYASVLELRDDVERYLTGDAVAAAPPSLGYRLRKFIRKNKSFVVGVSSFFLILVASVIVISISFFETRAALREKEHALHREEERRKEAESERIRARRAEANERDARERAEEAEAEANAEREKADLARADAERERDRVLRLSDIKKLVELQQEADALWPAYPEKLEHLDAWLGEACALSGNLDFHESRLATLKSEVESRSVESKEDVTRSPVDSRSEIGWQYDVLDELVSGLQRFMSPDPHVGSIADVERRIEFAKSVHKRTIANFDVEWTEAITSIRDKEQCAVYDGLVITPQLGLVPIGQDSHSGLWEFAHVQSGEIPDRDDDGNIIVTAEGALVLTLIPGGAFFMGGQSEDPAGENYDQYAKFNEGIEEIEVEPFFLSKYEMTQGQWLRFTGENPSAFNPTSHSSKRNRLRQRCTLVHPVEQVSWLDCDRVLFRFGLCLPTQAEWEYAARAGTATTWWTGDSVASLQGAANIADARCKSTGPKDAQYEDSINDGYSVHAPVGTYRANQFGLHDVIGNVWEWCSDQEETPTQRSHRMLRGGCFGNIAAYARSAIRDYRHPAFKVHNLGVRPARRIDLGGRSESE